METLEGPTSDRPGTDPGLLGSRAGNLGPPGGRSAVQTNQRLQVQLWEVAEVSTKKPISSPDQRLSSFMSTYCVLGVLHAWCCLHALYEERTIVQKRTQTSPQAKWQSEGWDQGEHMH